MCKTYEHNILIYGHNKKEFVIKMNSLKLSIFKSRSKNLLNSIKNISSFVIVLFFTILIFFSISGSASATNYYVATWGDDSDTGHSLYHAWATPSYAAQQAVAGDTIYLVDGTWTDEFIVFSNSGTEGNPITMTGYDSTPILDCSNPGSSNSRAIIMHDRDYINISNIKFTNYYRVVDSVRSSHIYLDNLTVVYTGEQTIYFQDVAYSSIKNCDLDGAHWNTILIGSSCSHITIENNKIHNNYAHALIDVYGSGGIIDNLIIKGNLFYDTGYPAIYTHGASQGLGGINWIIENNTAHGFTGNVIEIELKDGIIRDNVIYDITQPHAWTAYPIALTDGSNNVTMERNNIYDSELSEYKIYDGQITIRDAAGSSYRVAVSTGASATIEYTDGRTFSVDGSGEHTTYTITPGTHTIEIIGGISIGNISGMVLDAGTGLGIEEAIVTVEGTGKSGETDTNGDYTIDNVPTGTYTVTASKDGYHIQSKPSEVIADQTTIINIQLTTETTPPIITTHFPTGTNVLMGTSITVTFSEAMNLASAQSAFSISPSVTGSFSWDGNKMIFTPSSNLAYETTYTVNIGTEAEDLAGSNLESSYNWQFTTGTASSIVYVATDGSGDYNCDGIDDHIEINQATSYINSIGGGTVHLEAGIYTIDDIINIYSNMVFEGDGEENTIIELDASNSRTSWHLVDVDNLQDTTLQNFALDGNKIPRYTDNFVDAFHIYNSNNVWFNHITIRNVHTDGFEFYQSSDCSVTDCKVVHCGHDAIMNWFCVNMTHTDNYFEDLSNTGVRIANTRNSRVERNVCICDDTGIAIQCTNSDWPTENNLIKDNYIDNKRYNGDETIPIHAEGTGIIRNQTFIGNIIAHGGTYLELEGFRIFTSDSGIIEDIYIINNVIRDCHGEGAIYAENVDNVRNVVAKNNIIVDSTYGIYGKVTSSYNNFWNNGVNYGGGASAGTGDISVDPLFADPVNYDFHLKNTAGRWDGSAWVTDVVDSSCIDAGDPSSDYGDEPTPNGGRINMGAYGNTAEASKSAGVVPDNPPVARAGSDQTGYANESVTFDGSASTDDYGITSYVWDFDSSNGIQIDATDAVVSHTYTEPGSYIATLTVTDTSGNTDTDACMITVITVNSVNHAPVLDLIGNKSITVGALLQFTLTASDPDDDTLTYFASGLPDAASFDSATHIFSWTPVDGQVGSHQIHFEVTDGSLSDTEDVTITVNDETLTPIPDTPETTVSMISNPIVIDGNINEWVGANTVMFADNSGRGDLSVDNTANVKLTWDNNNFYIAFNVIDTNLQATGLSEADPLHLDDSVEIYIDMLHNGGTLMQIDDYHFIINLNNGLVDDVGTGSGKNYSWNSNIVYSVSVDGTLGNNDDVDNGYVIEVAIPWEDIGSLPHSGDVIGLNLAINDRDNPEDGQQDIDWCNLTTWANPDGWGDATFIGSTNHAPALNSIGDRSVNAGSPLQFTILATDPDNDPLTYSATGLPTGATFNPTTRTFSWTPDETQAGSYQVHFEVTDGSLIDAEDVTITVNGAAVEVTLTLYEGWNLVALPVINDGFTASSLASAIGDVSYVMKRNASDGGYQDYIVGFSGDADDFVISPDEGYYVYLDVVQKDFTIRGTQPGTRSIDLTEGWNLIGWTSLDPSDAVAAFVDPLGSKIKYAAKRNSPYGDYENYVAGFSEPADNFDVEPGYGYFVFVTSDCTWTHD